MEHCLVLQHLLEKYSSKGPASLYAGFIYLREAFDSMSRQMLWQRLCSSSIDKRLLYLVQGFQEETYLKVRCSLHGLSAKVNQSKLLRESEKAACWLLCYLFTL